MPPTCTGLLMAQYLCVRWSPQLHRPALINSRVGKVFATTMWFWIMFRGYHDLPHMLVRPPRRASALARARARGANRAPCLSQYVHQPWEHEGWEDHLDMSDEDDVFLANLKAAQS